MAYRDSGKTKLSKGILEMKFMKKSKDQALKEIQDEEGRMLFEDQLTEGMKAGISNYILEPSFIPCEGLIDGRLSFRGMNPEIERLMELEEIAKRPPVNTSMSADISDVEMVQYRQSLVETVASKYKSKKSRKSNEKKNSDDVHSNQDKPPKKKYKFIKPKDE
ncbi:M-phase phosphoprotein 6 [Homalodisca vitripennis]|uniref:M-phase phosphoprotein 6 n=1 Tax=Homalodisca vitripennis TaxID=197043 RepID=UPI001EE9BE16|nr:M-phase phosphoprotein 6 [Homalodisca vitripennis]